MPVPYADVIDYDSLSDEELYHLAKQEIRESKSLNSPAKDAASEVGRIANKVYDKAIKPVLDWTVIPAFEHVVQPLGEAYDAVGPAPARSAIYDYQKNKSLLSAVRSFTKQYAENPHDAPTGEDILKEGGMNENLTLIDKSGESYKIPTRALAGFGVEMLADPFAAIPISKIASIGTKIGAKTAKVAGKTALVVAEPVIGGVATKVIGDVGQGVSDSLNLLLNPKTSGEFDFYKQIAKKNKIDPSFLSEGHEFGDNSIITRATRQLREGTLGETQLRHFRAGLDKVKHAVSGLVERIGQSSPMTPVQAGEHIKDGYNKALSKMLEDSEVTYGYVAKTMPMMHISKNQRELLDTALDGLENFAKNRLKFGVTSKQKSQAKELLGAIQVLDTAKSNFSATVTVLKNVGEAAFSPANKFELQPPDVIRFKGLYHDVRKALVGTIRDRLPDGEAIADALEENNKVLTKFFKDREPLTGILGKNYNAPEKIFSSLVTNGDSTRIESLKAILDPSDFQKLKGAALEEITSTGKDGLMHYGTMRRTLDNKKAIFDALLSPDEMTDFEDLLKLGEAFGNPVLSTSGTGASNAIMNFIQGVKQSTANAATIEMLKDKARYQNLVAKGKMKAANVKSSASPVGSSASPVEDIIVDEIPWQPRFKKIDKAAKAFHVPGMLPTEAKKKEKDEAIQRRIENLHRAR